MAKDIKKKSQRKCVVRGTTVKDCVFSGATYDSKACESINTVAEGLLQTAVGLSILARVFNAQDIKIESLLKIGDVEFEK